MYMQLNSMQLQTELFWFPVKYLKLGKWELATERTAYPLSYNVIERMPSTHHSSGANHYWLLFGKLRVIVSKKLS